MKTKSKTVYKKPSIKTAILVILIMITTINSFYIWSAVSSSDKSANFQLAYQISQAINNLHHSPVTDATTGKQYMRDAKLVLPDTNQYDHGAIVYYYSGLSSERNNDSWLNIASQSAINTSLSKLTSVSYQGTKAVIDAVPKAQACSRGVQITFKPSEGFGDPYGSKVLSNGKTIYFYMENLCKDQSLIDYAKQVDSY